MPKLTVLEEVSKQANRHYWEVHALLMSCKLMVKELDTDDEWVPEISSLLDIATFKLMDMQGCFNGHLHSFGEVAHG